jgi:hypothetical protein
LPAAIQQIPPFRRHRANDHCDTPEISSFVVAMSPIDAETYNFHRLDLTRQGGFIVTIYDEDGLMLPVTLPCPSPVEAFAEARKIVDNKVEGPRK